MTDYARVAANLHAMIGDMDELYHHVIAPINKQALTIAAALCNAYAQPVDEAKERAEFDVWFREHYDIPLIRNSRAEAAWLARARSDARAKVAEQWQPIESLPETKIDVWFAFDDGDVMFAQKYQRTPASVWYPKSPTHFMLANKPLPPPPTVEGEQG